jgi:hypothetical protein
LSFAADTNLNGVAATIQAALVALEASSTVTWNSVFSRFQFTSGTTGAASTLSFLQTSAAAGKAVFAGQPTATHVLTVDGTAVTFVAAGPVGNQVMIGSTLAITLANLLAFLNSSVDANISLMTYSVTGDVLYMVAKATGTAGNTYTLTTSDGNITVTSPTGGSAGVDLSALLFGQATSSGAYVAEGVAAESAISAVQLFNNSFSGWYALYCCGTSDADTLAIAAFIEATVDPRHYFGVTTQEAGVIISTDTSDIAYLLAQAKYDHTGIQYSSTNPYACVSMLARILTTNWQGINTTIDLTYKQEPGVIAETLGTAQANAILAKNCNVYINYNNGTSIIQMGNSTSGNPIDTIIGLDWLANQIQTDVYNTLYTTTTKVPQTDPGEHAINAAISNACNTGVGNGLLAPGTWNSGGFGQLNQGDYLSKGFYVYQPPVALQPENLRAARQSVIFQVAAKEAGAVRDVAIQVLVNQ